MWREPKPEECGEAHDTGEDKEKSGYSPPSTSTVPWRVMVQYPTGQKGGGQHGRNNRRKIDGCHNDVVQRGHRLAEHVFPVVNEAVHSLKKPPQRHRPSEQPPEAAPHDPEQGSVKGGFGNAVHRQDVSEPERKKRILRQHAS